jgi:putative permease
MISVYVVLVPIMVFFILKDKEELLKFAAKFVPKRSELTFRVWREVDQKIANYIRGKFFEILIVWVVTFLVFSLMGLRYPLLLSFLVGLSVIIPYVGAIAVTVPVALVGYFQWGFSAKLGYLLLAYQVIQILDGNVLVPLLFSEVVNLHPLAIIVAVLFFGGLFGLWGVFFAIPLATLVQAVLNAWPKAKETLTHSA